MTVVGTALMQPGSAGARTLIQDRLASSGSSFNSPTILFLRPEARHIQPLNQDVTTTQPKRTLTDPHPERLEIVLILEFLWKDREDSLNSLTDPP